MALAALSAALDVARLEDVLGLLRLVGPDAGEAVGLQFDADLNGVSLPLAHPLPHRVDLIHDAEQVLHVMADLMRNHVGLGGVAWCVEAVFQLLVEGEVDIDLLILGAIERAHLRHADAAGRAHAAGKQHELRIAVSRSVLRKQLAPDVLGFGEHHRDELLEVVLACAARVLEIRTLRLPGNRKTGGVRARLRQPDVGEVRLIPAWPTTLHDDAGVDAEEEHQAEQDQQPDNADAAAPGAAAAWEAQAASSGER